MKSTVDVALMESREEFLQRYRTTTSSLSPTTQSRWFRPPTTTAVSSSTIKVFDDSSAGQPPVVIDVDLCTSIPPLLPLLTSNCPGWICFAEKTHPQAIPYISTVKSPQQILGVLIKSMIAQRSQQTPPCEGWPAEGSLQPSRPVLVVSVQPCYDKKLEASRLVKSHS